VNQNDLIADIRHQLAGLAFGEGLARVHRWGFWTPVDRPLLEPGPARRPDPFGCWRRRDRAARV